MGEKEGQGYENHVLPPIPHIGEKGEPNFDKIATLDVDTNAKDTVVRWAHNQERVEKAWTELDKLTRNLSLPKAERDVASEAANSALEKFAEVNNEIAKALKSESLAQSFLDIYIGFFDQTKSEKALIESSEDAATANKLLDRVDLVSAICTAIVETKADNPKLRQMRQKIAQSVFDEMFNQLSQDKLLYKHRIDAQPTSIIDSPVVEKSELTSALLSDPWTGKEREKANSNFERLHKGMKTLKTDRKYLDALNTLWRWADEGVPEDVSAFKILDTAEALYGGADEAFEEIWREEGEREREKREKENESAR